MTKRPSPMSISDIGGITAFAGLPPDDVLPFPQYHASCCRYIDILLSICILLASLNTLLHTPPAPGSPLPRALPGAPPPALLPPVRLLQIVSRHSLLLTVLLNSLSALLAYLRPHYYSAAARIPLVVATRLLSKLLLCSNLLFTTNSAVMATLLSDQCHHSRRSVALAVLAATMRLLPLKHHLALSALESAACLVGHLTAVARGHPGPPLPAIALPVLFAAALSTAATALLNSMLLLRHKELRVRVPHKDLAGPPRHPSCAPPKARASPPAPCTKLDAVRGAPSSDPGSDPDTPSPPNRPRAPDCADRAATAAATASAAGKAAVVGSCANAAGPVAAPAIPGQAASEPDARPAVPAPAAAAASMAAAAPPAQDAALAPAAAVALPAAAVALPASAAAAVAAAVTDTTTAQPHALTSRGKEAPGGPRVRPEGAPRPAAPPSPVPPPAPLAPEGEWRVRLSGQPAATVPAASHSAGHTARVPPPTAAAPGSTPGPAGADLKHVIAVVASRQGRRHDRAPYRSPITTSVISVKVHDHRAYAGRHALLPLLESHLLATRTPTLLTSTATPGCLQLLFRATQFLPPLRAPASPRASPPASPSGPPPSPDALLTSLYASLPSFCRDDTVSLHTGACRCTVPPPPALPQFATVPPPGCTIATAAAAGSSPALAPASPSLEVLPEVFAAGGSAPQVQINLSAGAAAAASSASSGQTTTAELVVCWTSGGAPCVHRQALAVTDGQATASVALPQAADTGPVLVYVLACDPAASGTLLASAATMALPPAAAAEVHASLARAAGDGDAAIHAGLLRLLADYAAAWQLLAAADTDGSAAGAALLAGLLQYCADAGLPACQAALSSACQAAGWLIKCVPQPQPPGGGGGAATASAAAATAGCGGDGEGGNGKGKGGGGKGEGGGTAKACGAATLPPGGAVMGGGAAAAAAVVPYAQWKLQGARLVDALVLVLMLGIGASTGVVMVRVVQAGQQQAMTRRLATVAAHVASLLAPHAALLAVPALQRHRAAVFALHYLSRGGLYLLGCACIVHHYKFMLVRFSVGATTYAINGFFRPISHRIPWQLQLPAAAFEEACKLLLMAAPACDTDFSQTALAMALPPFRMQLRASVLVVVLAVASSALLERVLLAAYQQMYQRTSQLYLQQQQQQGAAVAQQHHASSACGQQPPQLPGHVQLEGAQGARWRGGSASGAAAGAAGLPAAGACSVEAEAVAGAAAQGKVHTE